MTNLIEMLSDCIYAAIPYQGFVRKEPLNYLNRLSNQSSKLDDQSFISKYIDI